MAVQESEHLVGDRKRFVFLIDVVVQRVNDLVEAKSHAALIVLRMVLRVGKSGTGPERIVDLLE